LIAGYEWKSERLNLRVEGYDKRYRHLVTIDPHHWYSSGGHGYARGLDLFVQGTRGRMTGWVSYGYLDSKRKELDDPTEVPSMYGVRHSVTLVGEMRLTPFWMAGA